MENNDMAYEYDYRMTRNKQPNNYYIIFKWMQCNDMDNIDVAFHNDSPMIMISLIIIRWLKNDSFMC